tara:strand:+ start:9560 stop:10876 length:1317 start_codon:yes stop_codon:yes gene_type:complete
MKNDLQLSKFTHKNILMTKNAPTDKKEIFSWIMYDFANSAYPTIITTVAFSVFFKEVITKGIVYGDLLWGSAISLSMLLSIIIAIPLSAIADISDKRKTFLFIFSFICIIFTALLSLLEEGMVVSAIIIFVISSIGFECSIVFYNSYLPNLSTKENIGRISGWGWGLGYFGGLLCLILCYPFLKDGYELTNQDEFKKSFLITSIFFALFSLPMLFTLRKSFQENKLTKDPKNHLIFEELYQLIKQYKKNIDAMKFLIAFFLFNDGIITIIAFCSIYAVSTLSFTMQENLILFICIQISAGLGSFVFGYVSDYIGHRKTLISTLFIWCLIIISAFLNTSKEEFFIIGIGAGILLGSTQSSSRAMMASYIPEMHEAKGYAIYGICGKFSSILGPITFGVISSMLSNQRLAILSILIFFIPSIYLLCKIRDEEGKKEKSNE